MSNSFIPIITLLIIFFLYRFYIALNGKIRNFSITSLFCLYYIAFVVIGSVLINCFRFDAEEEFGVYSKPDVLLYVWLYSILGLISIFVGFVFSHYTFRRIAVKRIISTAAKSDIVYRKAMFSKKSFSTIIICFIIVIIVAFLYRNAIGKFPIELIFSGLSAADLVILRSDATNGFIGKAYRYDMFMDELPLFLFILVSLIKRGGGKKKWGVLYISLLSYNIFYALSTLQKAPILKLIILSVIIFLFVNKTIKKKYIILLGALMPTLVVLMYIFFMGREDSPVSEIMQGALHRIFVGSIIPFFWYIIYVDQKGFLFGTSFPNPAGILPFEHVPLTKEIALIGQSGVGDAVGSMPTCFIGEMYANFGVLGIIISCILFGFVLQSLDIYYSRKMKEEKDAFTCAIYIYLIFYFTKYSESALSSIVLDTSLFMVLIFIYIYKQRLLKYDKSMSCH